jgi:hypothetical protein
MDGTRAALHRAYAHALDWLDSLPTRQVNSAVTAEQLLSTLDEPTSR